MCEAMRLREEACRNDAFLQGQQEGMQEGRLEGMQLVAKKMLERHLSIEKIAEYTGLTVEEIQSLRDVPRS